jgi:hypothetical protein
MFESLGGEGFGKKEEGKDKRRIVPQLQCGVHFSS